MAANIHKSAHFSGKEVVFNTNNLFLLPFQGLIKDVHTDVINDDLENLKNRVNPPVPSIVLYGKDANGLTPLHKVNIYLFLLMNLLLKWEYWVF